MNTRDTEPHKKYISVDTDYYASLTTVEKSAFRMWFAMLAKRNNNRLYNVNSHKLAKQLNVSINAFYRYRKILIKLGLLRKLGKDLLVIPQQKEDKIHYSVFKVYRSIKINHVEELIQLDLLKKDKEQQQYNILLKDQIQDQPKINILDAKLAHKLVRTHKKAKMSREVDYKDKTSFRRIARQSGLSIKKSHDTFKQLEGKGLIKSKLSLRTIKHNSSMEELIIYSEVLQKENFGRYIQLYLSKKNTLYIVEGTNVKINNSIIIDKPKQLLRNSYFD